MSALTALVDSIKFQLLVKQLDDVEFDTFLAKLWRRNGKGTVMQLLQSEYEEQHLPIRDQPRRHETTTGNSLADTPSQLIGEIASFLDYSSYISFSSTNRKMFVDCNSPNRLTQLDLSKFAVNDPSFCWKNYPKLNCLYLNLHQMPSLNISRAAITQHCPVLRTLCLDAHRNEEDPTYSIDDFIADNIGTCGAINTLALFGFQKKEALNSQQLTRLLTEFPALTRLELVGMQCGD